MNEKLKKLLNQINAKKKEIQDLIGEDKLEEAKKAKEELDDLQAKFDILKDVVDEEEEVQEERKPVGTKNDAVAKFAAAARHRFRNAATDAANEGNGEDGGYTVPQDIQTRINEYKQAKFTAADLVYTEKVTTMSGSRTYTKKTQHTGFTKVSEQGKIGKANIPQFENLEYKIDKYGGWLPATNELLADSDAKIANYLIKWLGEEDIATRNVLVFGELKKASPVDMTGIDDIKTAVNVTLGQAYAGDVAVVTNDDGLNFLDTLKDKNDRYLLSPDLNPDSPFKMRLAVGATNIPVVVVPNGILPTETDKVPFFAGDFEEAVVIFDREKMSIKSSDVASVEGFNAFEQDMTLFRAIDRLDVKTKDAGAWVYLQLTKTSGN